MTEEQNDDTLKEARQGMQDASDMIEGFDEALKYPSEEMCNSDKLDCKKCGGPCQSALEPTLEDLRAAEAKRDNERLVRVSDGGAWARMYNTGGLISKSDGTPFPIKMVEIFPDGKENDLILQQGDRLEIVCTCPKYNDKEHEWCNE